MISEPTGSMTFKHPAMLHVRLILTAKFIQQEETLTGIYIYIAQPEAGNTNMISTEPLVAAIYNGIFLHSIMMRDIPIKNMLRKN